MSYVHFGMYRVSLVNTQKSTKTWKACESTAVLDSRQGDTKKQGSDPDPDPAPDPHGSALI